MNVRGGGPYIHGAGRVTSNQGRAGGMREPHGVVRMMVPGGAKGGRSQGGANSLTSRGGVMGSVAGGRARGFPSKPELVTRRSEEHPHSGADKEGAEELKGTSGGRAHRLAGFGRGGGRRRLCGISGDAGDLELGRTSRGKRFKVNIFFQFIVINKFRGQTQHTFSGGSVDGAFIHALILHEQPHGDGRCCQLTHLVRLTVTLGLRGGGWLSSLTWLSHCSRLGLSICGGLWHLIRAEWGGWLAELLVWSGAGDILFGADGERQSTVHLHPLHILHKCPPRTNADIYHVPLHARSSWHVENAQGAISGILEARQLSKSLDVVLKGLLLHAKQPDGWQVDLYLV